MLSVIITFHNDEKYIHQCLNSVVSQLNDYIEVICTDDASADSTLQLLNEYSALTKLIRFPSNVGLASARNTAIRAAKGKYIMFIDGDDYIAPQTFNRLLPLLNTHEYDIVFGTMETFKDTPDTLDCWRDPLTIDESIFENNIDNEIVSALYTRSIKITPAQKYIVSKALLLSNHLWFESILHEDQLWIPKALCLAKKIGYLNYKFYFHRIRDNSLGNRFDESVCESYFVICYKLLAFSQNVEDTKLVRFVKLRCEYLLDKINNRITEWNIERRNNFLVANRTTIDDLSNTLNLNLYNLQ